MSKTSKMLPEGFRRCSALVCSNWLFFCLFLFSIPGYCDDITLAKKFNDRLMQSSKRVQHAAECFAKACVEAISMRRPNSTIIRARLADLRKELAAAKHQVNASRLPESPNAKLMKRYYASILHQAQQTTEHEFMSAARILSDRYYTPEERAAKLQFLLRQLPPASKEIKMFFEAQKRLAGEFGLSIEK